MTLDDVSPGVRYWRCDGCGFVWATRDGDDLRAPRASKAIMPPPGGIVLERVRPDIHSFSQAAALHRMTRVPERHRRVDSTVDVVIESDSARLEAFLPLRRRAR